MTFKRLPHKINRGLQVYTDYYLRRRTPVLIYTTGRVGSMALHHALRNQLAIQMHTLDPAKLLDNQQPGTAVWAYNHIIKPGRPAKIINIVRDPLAIMISDFFPKLKWITGQADAYATLSVDELCEVFVNRYFEEGRHLEKLNWFEDEMQQYLGIDVYAHPFSPEDGFTRFEHKPYTVLIIRTELDDAQKAHIVADFVGSEALQIEQRNVGQTKVYGEVYKVFKEQLVVPDEQLDIVYNSRLAQHFYSADERQRMRAPWVNPPQKQQIV